MKTATHLDEEVDIDYDVTHDDIASIPSSTIYLKYLDLVEKCGNKDSYHFKRVDGKWDVYSWKEMFGLIKTAARQLIHYGIKRFDGISVIGFNSPPFIISYLAAIFSSAICSGIYTTNGPDGCKYVAEKLSVKIVFSENEIQTKKFIDVIADLPSLQMIVQWSGTIPQTNCVKVISWEEFMTESEDKDMLQKELDERIGAQKPNQCCSVIWTSGTTGPPKGVMISHDNILWLCNSLWTSFDDLTENERMVSYLPLSHIAAQISDMFLPIIGGHSIWFAQPDALKGTLAVTLKEVQPTIFFGVPRVWEKMEEKMRELGGQTTGLKRSIALWAKGIGKQATENLMKGEDVPWGWWLANTLVLKKVKEALGLSQAKYFLSAAAPLSVETIQFFIQFCIPIAEWYGMSEAGISTFQVHGTKHKIGTVGRAIHGSLIKIDPGTDEILLKSRSRFLGYHENPEETSQTIDEEGWIHSGDAGHLDEQGYLTITGRLKELVITAGGENIPPVLIETEVKKELSQLVNNAMIVGDKKKFLSCLVTLKVKPLPDHEVIPGDYPLSDVLLESSVNFLESNGISDVKTASAAATHEKVLKLVENGIERANTRAMSHAQKIQKVFICPIDFTIEGKELTDTMKLKRRIVLSKYSAEIESLY